jgi:CPA2 family monovalent cation:H+ antiporter-2
VSGSEINLIIDFSLIMIVASLIIVIFHKLRQPLILGYILAGIIIGPHFPYFSTVSNIQMIEGLAELGIVILLFALGLTFSFSKLRDVGWIASISGSLVIILMIGIGYILGLSFGWSEIDSFFLGSMIAISSTAVITKEILDKNLTHKRSSQIIFGILIIEDIAAVIILTVISGIAITGEFSIENLTLSMLYIALFILTLIIFGILLAPKLIAQAAKTKSKEILVITALGICFGFAFFGYTLGFSFAIGAFVIGAVLGDCPEGKELYKNVEPLKDVFLAIFFISIGMLIAPDAILVYWLPIVIITFIFIVAKMALSGIGTFFFGNSARTALNVGITMGVLGEFSYLIAREGNNSGVMSDFLFPTIVTASIFTLVINTYISKHSHSIANTLDKKVPVSVKRWMAFITLQLNYFKLRISTSKPISKRIKRYLKEVILNVGVIFIIILTLKFVVLYSLPLLEFIGLDNNFQSSFIILISIFAMVLILSAFTAMVRSIFHIIENIALPIFSTSPKKRLKSEIIAYQIFRAVAFTLMIIIGTFLVVFIIVIYIPFQIYDLIIFLAMTSLVLYIFFHSVDTFNIKIKTALTMGFEDTGFSKKRETEKYPHRDVPFEKLLRDGDAIQRLIVDEKSPYAGKLIKNTNIRKRYNASVIGIQRNKQMIINPSPDEKLQEKDVLILLITKIHE